MSELKRTVAYFESEKRVENAFKKSMNSIEKLSFDVVVIGSGPGGV